jgi:hypothetical protein
MSDTITEHELRQLDDLERKTRERPEAELQAAVAAAIRERDAAVEESKALRRRAEAAEALGGVEMGQSVVRWIVRLLERIEVIDQENEQLRAKLERQEHANGELEARANRLESWRIDAENYIAAMRTGPTSLYDRANADTLALLKRIERLELARRTAEDAVHKAARFMKGDNLLPADRAFYAQHFGGEFPDRDSVLRALSAAQLALTLAAPPPGDSQ